MAIGGRTPLVLALVVLVACVAASQREPDPGGSPSTDPGDGRSPEGVLVAAEVPEAGAQARAPEPEVVASVPEGKRVVAKTVQPGLAEFAAQVPEGGALWIGPLPANGERDVVIWIPPGSRASAKFQLVYHFHGTHSERVQAKAPGVPKKVWVGWDRLQQTLDAATELQTRRDYNVALIYPISAGKRPEPGHKGWFNKEYDRIWMAAPESFDALHDQVAAILDAELGVPAASLRPRVIAEGHSAGGIALRNIAVAGSRRVGEYIFQDASFQGWADGCHAAVQAAGSDALVTIVLTDRGIADPFGKRDPWCLDLESDAKAWAGAKAWCADPARAKKRPAGGSKPCAELEAGATEWEDYAAWCTALKDEMRDVPNVFVHRTKIPHGAQPRHFTGGLELPDPRP